MSKFLLNIGEAAELLGVTTSTLRRWEKEKKLIPDERTRGGQRRYKLSSLNPVQKRGISKKSLITIGYARVSSSDQKKIYDDKKNCLKSIAQRTAGHTKLFLILVQE
jgi:putative resolvase